MGRLDQALVEQGFFQSREKAQRAIMAGQVFLNEQLAAKASDKVKSGDQIRVASPEKFVSRGGYKLEHALNTFGLRPKDWTVIDLGASTGGFTDCLLQAGAAKVFAIDVGHGQLAWKLRQDPRVIVLEKTNARDLTPASFSDPGIPVDLIVIDCSFILLRHLIPATVKLLKKDGKIIALVKPQFEAGKKEADKGSGVIKDPAVHSRVLQEVKTFIHDHTPYIWRAQTESPLLGPAGNKEFLILLEKAHH